MEWIIFLATCVTSIVRNQKWMPIILYIEECHGFCLNFRDVCVSAAVRKVTVEFSFSIKVFVEVFAQVTYIECQLV